MEKSEIPRQETTELPDLERDFVISGDDQTVSVYLSETEWKAAGAQHQSLRSAFFTTLREFRATPGHEDEFRHRGFEIAIGQLQLADALFLQIKITTKLNQASIREIRNIQARTQSGQLNAQESLQLGNAVLDKSERVLTLIDERKFSVFVREDVSH